MLFYVFPQENRNSSCTKLFHLQNIPHTFRAYLDKGCCLSHFHFAVIENNTVLCFVFSVIDAWSARPECRAPLVHVRPHSNSLNHRQIFVFVRPDEPQCFTIHCWVWTVFSFAKIEIFNQNTKIFSVHCFYKSKSSITYWECWARSQKNDLIQTQTQFLKTESSSGWN